MATIHLMHGFIGFGKTTIAKKLARELPAVRLNNDEFMESLYGRNPPAEMFQEYYDRIDDLLWSLAEQITKVGIDVIMDIGFWSKETRAKVFARAKTITEGVIFHSVRCDMETAKQRMLTRTASDKSELQIDEAAFDKFRAQFEPMEESEGYEIIIHK